MNSFHATIAAWPNASIEVENGVCVNMSAGVKV